MKMKKLFAVMSLAVLLTACGGGDKAASAPADSDVIKIGGIVPKTGAAAVYGNTTDNGIKLAVEEINANGGINGKQVEYVSEDDKGDPTEAVTIYNKLVEGGNNVIIGAITSKPSLAVADNSAADGIPIITPTGTSAAITEGKANVFRTCFTDPLQGKILANFAADNLSAKTAAVLRNTSNDYSNGVADEFINQAKTKGIEVVADEGYGDSDVDFKVQLTNIKNQNPDVILVPEYYEKDVSIIKQARELGIESKIIGPDGWDGVLSVIDQGSVSLLDGVYFTNHYSLQDENEKVQNFVNAYKEKYNEDPSAFSALGYDTVYIYKTAIENAKSMEFTDIVDAVKAVEISGVTGDLKFGENNNPIKSATIIEIKDGAYQFNSLVSAE
ncbi:ABC transporter substrate-binding protein [Peptoniphilus sp. MSJ-1]|uniref:ABC transporter substrate-binding protein n=1 Tax=Peptoniphilus ovalis TaxID=2841503 RepID=A0ABS6FJQ8_9FIRM|nr:ABC transporter substrate-binding protein [Peptoniphilus ovalis]MBU5669737.1 ABC transporter substrate-binding protein [Peptoniphilus ovalis]